MGKKVYVNIQSKQMLIKISLQQLISFGKLEVGRKQLHFLWVIPSKYERKMKNRNSNTGGHAWTNLI